MSPLEPLSEPGQQSHLSSTTIPDLTNKITRPDDWQYCEAGGFGDVFRCQYTSAGGIKEVAVKAFRFGFSVDENKHDEAKAARMIRRELGIWRRLGHRNIVPFLGIAHGFGRQGSASLVSTWMPHGTLHTVLEVHDDRLAVAHRLQLLSDIANGLHYLHSFPLVHGDLTSNNVLLDHNYNACLTDFGCASLLGELPDAFAYLKVSTVRPGTLRWAAPEHFSLNEEETKHTTKSDIYSFGNMAFLVLSGNYPWGEIRTDAAVMLRLSQGLKPGRPLARPIDDRHWALIERCWSSIPERPLAEDVVSCLQQLLHACTPVLPLCDLLGIPPPPHTVPSHPGNDLRPPLIEDADDRAEETLGENAEAGSSHNNASSGNTKTRHIDSSASTSSTCTADVSLDGPRQTSKWVRGELLGRGTYGCVYLALDTSTGEVFAAKQVNKRSKGAWHHKYVSSLKMEREIISGLNHPHIVAYFGSEETETSLSIFVEYVPGASIGGCLRKYGKFSEELIKSFTTQIFDALAYLHASYIIHRNIEANNVLVDPRGICKLSGFGNAQRADDKHASWLPMRGTVPWTAPEVTSRQGAKRYGPKVDVWSAGYVSLEMWSGRTLHNGDMVKLWQVTSRGMSPPLPSDLILSDLAVDFKERCFAVDPEKRASAVELLQHPYLALEPDWVFTGFK